MLAVQVLVQAVVVACTVLQQQRRRLGLPGIVTAAQECCVFGGETGGDAHRLIPAVGDCGQRRIERLAQRCHRIRQRIGEVLVFSAPEAVPRHDDAAAEGRILGVEGC
jgi:hypothetical protein